MANWDKLNSELDSVLDSMTSEDWSSWYSNRESQKRMRQYEMVLKRRMKEESILLSEIKGSQSHSENINSLQFGINMLIPCNLNDLVNTADNTSYALAA
jgi:hypothetical protein